MNSETPALKPEGLPLLKQKIGKRFANQLDRFLAKNSQTNNLMTI